LDLPFFGRTMSKKGKKERNPNGHSFLTFLSPPPPSFFFFSPLLVVESLQIIERRSHGSVLCPTSDRCARRSPPENSRGRQSLDAHRKLPNHLPEAIAAATNGSSAEGKSLLGQGQDLMASSFNKLDFWEGELNTPFLSFPHLQVARVPLRGVGESVQGRS